jgi:hypothetical protein
VPDRFAAGVFAGRHRAFLSTVNKTVTVPNSRALKRPLKTGLLTKASFSP